MSTHLLRQGVRSCRITTPRLLASARRSYPSQAAQALLISSASHGSSASQTPVEANTPATSNAAPDSPSVSSPPRPSKRASRQSSSPPQLKPAVAAADHVLKPSRVDLYLASISAAGLEPQLEDLDKCKPAKHPNEHSVLYAEAYNNLVDTLCRSFSKDQLQKFILASNMEPWHSKPKRRKIQFAESLIEQRWNWPSLKAMEKAKRDRTEVTTELYPVSPSLLFLILGRDGADLLQLTMKYKVHISLASQPLSLRVEGLRGSLGKLRQQLDDIRGKVVEETIRLPTNAPIESHLLQRISRLAGAYIENVGNNGLVRLCAKSEHDLKSAKRLAIRAITEIHNTASTPLLSYLPVGVPSMREIQTVLFSYSYSLYPFLASRALPWYMSTAGAFRIRRVNQWLEQGGEDLTKTGGLAEGKGRILTVNHEAVTLRDFLMPTALTAFGEGSRRRLKATLGHLLFTGPTESPKTKLTPPLYGAHHFNRMLEWVQSRDSPTTFVSSLPAALVESSPQQQRLIHRVVYRAFSPQAVAEAGSTSDSHVESVTPVTHDITLEVVLAQRKEEAAATQQASAEPASVTEEMPAAEEVSEEPSADKTDELTATEDLSEQPTSIGTPSLTLSPRLWSSTETEVDLMLPDRASDVRFTASDETEFSVSDMPALSAYVDELQAFLSSGDKTAVQPDPPLTLERDGRTYILHTSATIRQSTEDRNNTDATEGADPPFSVIGENVFDLESNERTTRCEVICNDPASEAAWTAFLRECDVLSASKYRSTGTIPLLGDELDLF